MNQANTVPNPKHPLHHNRNRTVTENGTTIGTVKAVQNFGASDLLEIKPSQGAAFYLPYTTDYIGEIDLDAQTIEVFNASDFQDI